jgi:hypothetical protein
MTRIELILQFSLLNPDAGVYFCFLLIKKAVFIHPIRAIRVPSKIFWLVCSTPLFLHSFGIEPWCNGNTTGFGPVI